MLKQIRDFMRMLDEIEEDDDASDAPRVLRRPVAVELPHSVEPSPAAPAAPSKVFVFDTDVDHAGSLAAMLTAGGTEASTFTETESFVRGLFTDTPAMVFLDVCGQGNTAIDALVAMGKRNYQGGVQLMGAESSPLIDVVRHMGERHALQMLPAVRKPLDVEVVRRALLTQEVILAPAPSVGLAAALASEQVDFWYQPKIDLQRRQVAGVESFARVTHPELGVLLPPAFLRGATEGDLARLSHMAIAAALAMVRNLSDVGIHLRIAVNMPVRALMSIPVIDMVREHGPQHQRWPGLLLDVSAVQLAANFDLVAAQAPGLVASKIHLAIDDFNGNTLSLARLRELPVAELKIEPTLVAGCDKDASRAKVCRSVIDLAHHIGCQAIAVGIEQQAELELLTEMGCDVGQGFLFGQPMPEPRLAGILMKRAVSSDRPRPAAAAPSSRLKRAVWN